ncbi:MAG: tripartite tricarboxylate transporter permease, partial [Theionarchaea archaeon]|nr:tripartite tricarboxylate transporter permease [Theionarchaea archaeon]
FTGEYGAVFIFSLVITHTFVDFIPSTLFGVPDDETVLSILPAHRLLLGGRGYEAVKLTVIGGLGAFICSCIFFFPLFSFLSNLFLKLSPYIGYLILVSVIYIILFEKTWKKISFALLIFFLSGSYGYIVLSGHLLPEDRALFPVFSGLFGLPNLLLSMKTCTSIPFQVIDGKVHVKMPSLICSILKGGAAGMIVSLFPGIGPSHASALLSVRSSSRQFLISVSGVNTANAVFGLAVLYALGKSRSGALMAIRSITDCNAHTVGILLSSGCIACGVAALSTLALARIIIKIVLMINYRYVSMISCGLITVTVGLMTGVIGFLILGIGCCIGLLPVFMGIRRIHCMGVLLFPILIYYIHI